MTRLSAFLSMQEWPINLNMLQNNKAARKITFIPMYLISYERNIPLN